MAPRVSDIPDESTVENEASLAAEALLRRRRTWLKRLGIGIGLGVVGLFLLRVSWGFAAHHRLTTQIAEYRAAGQLVDVEEFDAELDAVIEAQNAAALFEKAMDGMVSTTASGVQLHNLFLELSSFDTSMSEAYELMQSNAGVLDLVRQARHLPDAAWSDRLAQPQIGLVNRYGQRLLAQLLWFAVAYDFRTGDHAAAMATMQDYVAFNNAVDSHPSRISNFLACQFYRLGFSLIEEYGGGLNVEGGGDGLQGTVTPASREQVQELVRELLSEQSMRRNAVRSYHGDRSLALQTLQARESLGPLTVSPFKRVWNFMLDPVLVLDTARDARDCTSASQAVAEATWPEAARYVQAAPVNAHLVFRLAHPITCTKFGPAYRSTRRGVRSFFKTLARRRMAATALAVRLYEVDHGERPVELTALVPRYLRQLPQDPFAMNGSTFAYRPLAERAFLYSVGPDGQDNEGQVLRGSDGQIGHERGDLLFYLDDKHAFRPASSPSIPETDDNDKDIEHGQGQQRQK